MRFFEYPVTGDRAEHAAYNVGPATDYATPIGTVIDAPFAGYLTPFWTDEGGNSLRLVGTDATFVAQHLDQSAEPGEKAWRASIAISGNSGTQTGGPHVHAYIILKETGERVSFSEWLRGYTADNAPQAPSHSLIGREVDLDGWYWYRDARSADRAVNARGGDRGGGTMLDGRYWINGVSEAGSLYVTSRANGRVWVHASAVSRLVP